MIVRGKEGAALDVRQDIVEGGIGDRYACLEGGPAADPAGVRKARLPAQDSLLIHDDQRPVGGVLEDRSGSVVFSEPIMY